MSQTKAVDEIKTHISCSITFFRKFCRLWDNVEKYGRARQATDDNIIRRMHFACWITKAIHTHTHTHTHRICNTYCFSTTTIVTRTRLNVTLYVHCILCNVLNKPPGWVILCWCLCFHKQGTGLTLSSEEAVVAFLCNIYVDNYRCSKHAVAWLVEALRYKPERRGFDSLWCHWNFSLT
jgi:hypothetical protein